MIQFKNGYSKDCPSFIADCYLTIGTGNETWGAEKDEQYYIIHIQKIVWKSADNLGGFVR